MAPVTSFAARGSATAPAPQSLCREALAGAACRRGLATGPTNNDARTALLTANGRIVLQDHLSPDAKASYVRRFDRTSGVTAAVRTSQPKCQSLGNKISAKGRRRCSSGRRTHAGLECCLHTAIVTVAHDPDFDAEAAHGGGQFSASCHSPSQTLVMVRLPSPGSFS